MRAWTAATYAGSCGAAPTRSVSQASGWRASSATSSRIPFSGIIRASTPSTGGRPPGAGTRAGSPVRKLLIRRIGTPGRARS